MKRYWLMKTEPSDYSIDDLERDATTSWDGIRNYQARNIIRDDIKAGDEALVYHSGGKSPGVAGTARVVGDAYPDPSARDKHNEYYDKRAGEDNPIWYCVDIEFISRFPLFVPLSKIKSTPELQDMMVTRRGIRLSIQPVDKEHFDRIIQLGNRSEDE